MRFRPSKLAPVLALLLVSASAHAKKVHIEWREIKGAVQYEIQVEHEGKVVAKKTFDDTAWSGDLPSGVYTYQVRAIDRVKRPGKWSDPKALVVMPKPPEPSFPPDGKSVVLYNPMAGTTLKWEPIPGVKEYVLDVKEGSRTVYNGTVKDHEITLKALPAGKYAWQIIPVIKPAGRAPASLQGRQWEGKPSELAEFKIEHSRLEPPVPVSPVGVVDPPSDGTMKFKWKPVEGAEAYEVELVTHSRKRKPAEEEDGEAPNTFITKENTLVASVAAEGQYTWRVRALANFDAKAAPGATSERSAADFKIDRNASYFEGSGYVAISTMLAPYTYEVNSPSTGVDGTVSSAAVTMRLSGEYWFRPQWGIGVGAENTFFTIADTNYSRKTLELNARYRIKFGESKFSWVLSPKVGLETRDWFEILPADPSGQGINEVDLTTLGPSVGFDLRKQLSEKMSLGLKVGYYVPVRVMSSTDGLVGNITSAASYRNLSIGLQGFYWLSSKWGVGAGGYLEHRSISYTADPQTFSSRFPGVSVPTTSEEIYTDGTYFFGSLLYSFGH